MNMKNRILNFFAALGGSKKRWVDFETSTSCSSLSVCYAITVCNEAEELRKLLTLLSNYKQSSDTILVQKDKDRVTEEVCAVLTEFSGLVDTQVEFPLNDDFGTFKNNLLAHTTADYVFQLDADELPSPYLLENFHSYLSSNPQIEAFRLPRINLIKQEDQSLTVWEDMDKVSPSDYFHFPDYQFRIFKNIPSIRWHKKVHEVIIGYKTYCLFPKTKVYALLHSKYQSKQDRQIEYYEKLKKNKD